MKKNITVAKFGGSSVGTYDGMKRCAQIIVNNPTIKVVVVSATYNSTNQLELMAQLTKDKKFKERDDEFDAFKKRHHLRELANASLNLLEGLYDEAQSIMKKMESEEASLELKDALVSIGELVSSYLFSYVLKQEFLNFKRDEKIELVDIRNFIVTDNNFGQANPCLDIMQERFKHFPTNENDENKIIVTQGFIARTIDGRSSVLGREGSDFSAGLIASFIDADVLQIWTDVAGFFTADPKKTKYARVIPEMSYEDAQTLGELGAKVLFPRTHAPAKNKNIPISILSSYEPKLKGTLIKKDAVYDSKVVGMAVNHNVVSILLSDEIYMDDIKNLFRGYDIQNPMPKVLKLYLEQIELDKIHALLFKNTDSVVL